MHVVTQYPTASKLALAKAETLANLPHVDLNRARMIVEEARRSVAALNDAGSALAMRLVTEEIRRLDQTIEEGKKDLAELMANDPRIAVLNSIPGIGTWSAIALTLEIGDVSRFTTVRSLIAWAGLDPRQSVSGDGVVKHGISHKGNANIRAVLYMAAMAAIVHNPVVAAFYRRLTTGDKPKPGKVALVACMAKLLRIAYAMMRSSRTFQAEYEQNRAASIAVARQAARSAPGQGGSQGQQTPAPPIALQLDAPITRKEARRRRQAAQKATAPGPGSCEVKPQAGTGTAALAVSPLPSVAKGPRMRT